MLTVGSLFSGIGGLDLGLERAGMNVIWQSEINEYASRVLKKHWPEVPNHGDIKKINWRNIVRPDVICGGYPCQPFSTAGKQQGANDPRHLWPWVRQAISKLRPRYAILENVRGHLSVGGVAVIGDLAAIGYNCEWRVISAASLGAPHRRERIVIVAYPNTERNERIERHIHIADTARCCTDVTTSQTAATDKPGISQHALVFGNNSNATTQGGKHWISEPDVGRMVDGFPNRMDRLNGLGNAVVPKMAETVGKLVVAHAQRV